MSMLEIFLVWFAGLVNGVVFTAIMVFHIGNRALKNSKKRTQELVKQLTTEDSQYGAVAERMTRIKEIAKQQMELQAAADGPQRNSMDGKYKNQLMAQMKLLEEEKVEILRSIISDGFDPNVSLLREDGTTEIVKLSEFFAVYDPAGAIPKEDGPTKQVGKFTVLQGGKDSKGNPTIH